MKKLNFMSVDNDDLNRMTTKQARVLLSQARLFYRNAKKVLMLRGVEREEGAPTREIWSPALSAAKEMGIGEGAIKSKTRNQVMQEIYAIRKFLNYRTSTPEGSREVIEEQNRRIFGNTEQTMTIDERENFWSLYMEFKKTFKTAEAQYGSERIQQVLAEMQVNHPDKLLADKITDAEKILKGEVESRGYKPNVRTGRGDD